jgi:hypothetical protein
MFVKTDIMILLHRPEDAVDLDGRRINKMVWYKMKVMNEDFIDVKTASEFATELLGKNVTSQI